jgi:hypothetical protein
VLIHHVPSASPLNSRGSPGESRFKRDALNHSATSPTTNNQVYSSELLVRSK